MRTVEPDATRLAAFLSRGEDDSAIVMINLLRYRERADYPDRSAAEPCSGREAYQRYGSLVAKMIADAGGRIVWMGSVQTSVIAPEGEKWDDALLVEYPSRNAFVEMVSRTDYQAAALHRTAALEDSRLIATRTAASLLDA